MGPKWRELGSLTSGIRVRAALEWSKQREFPLGLRDERILAALGAHGFDATERRRG